MLYIVFKWIIKAPKWSTPKELVRYLHLEYIKITFFSQVTSDESKDIQQTIFIKAEPFLPQSVRLVTHADVSVDDIKDSIKKLLYVISEYDNYFVIEYNVWF